MSCIIGLGTVTIVSMVLWSLLSVVGLKASLGYTRHGLVAMWIVAAVWATGVV